MITAGDTVPEIELRTDEGTPLALTDIRGRALCLFLLGSAFTPTIERLLELLGKNVNRFLSMNISPVVVFGDSVENLADHRASNDAPFILLSDEAFALHERFRGNEENLAAVWLINENGTVLDIVPMLPPTELLAVTLERAARVFAEDRRKG